ncbi:MAG: 1-deoxy-D-xylulose-5-phosphate synthase [Bacteroidales bacterium]|jgi:1-deoxy-D-xylulose-5-phosphate synthase|nr:1-deoxy-D-xylulose-5-phosphate synthase [Bacteroidales bacterium]
MYELLDKIDSPEDLKKLQLSQLPQLCEEVRRYILECCAVNPGHVGSSLGAVELIVALHYIYDTPADKLVFDVGHQAYAHKILTGRREIFRQNRTLEGISGFPKRDESPYDAFGAGHSSTSISAALGFAEAARMMGTGEKSVAIIGDGALTGGLAWEGLNNAGSSKADILVILNDNNISIDKNIGGLHEYLLNVTTHPFYNRIKNKVWNTLGDGKARDWVQKRVIDTKSNLVRSSGGALFESLGFRYFGPIDGNDIEQLIYTLERLRNLHGPRLLHIHTRKGAGYAPAMADPTVWHAPGKFNPETGERIRSVYPADRYQDVFGKVLVELAQKDEKVVGVTPAMASGCGMNLLEKAVPERFFDVGIEEEHAVTFSAGLAAAGMKPFCNIYSSFSQRAYDGIIHDVALQHLPVVFCFDRAGLVGEDGPTHHGCFDLAAYRSIPGVIVSAPRNEIELKRLMYTGLSLKDSPLIIRYPRGIGEGVAWQEAPYEELPVGRGEKLLDGKDVAVLGLGPGVNRALAAALRCKEEGMQAPAVYDMRFLKPLDTDILEEVSKFKVLVTIEDGTLKGGLYGAVSEYFAGSSDAPVIKGVGIPDSFIPQDTQKAQRASCGMDEESLYILLAELLKNM